MADKSPHVVIIGAGFGGMEAAKELKDAPVRITLIDRRNYHLFQPLLYQVATAGLAPENIAHPVRPIFRGQDNVEFRMADVAGIDMAEQYVQTTTGMISYDYLIVAVGSQTNFFGMKSLEEHSFGLKSLEDSINVRNHILRLFELATYEQDPIRRRAILTFVVAGGGPTGVESAGALSELIRLVMVKDYPRLDFSDVRVLLLEGSNQLLPGMSPLLSEATQKILHAKQVEVQFQTMVTGFDGTAVALKGGEQIPAHTLLWAAGIRAEGLIDTLGIKQAGAARAVVESTLQLPQYPNVFVIGDAAFLIQDDHPLPMIAPVAIQQAKTAGANIKRLIAGQTTESFTYKDVGAMATIGRNAAVVKFGKWQFYGFIAWLMWLFVHLIRLVGFRNRLLVLLNWAWEYVFYERAVRLIIPK